jgi:Acetyltransferase (isoleucine patch superfamily)
MAHVNLAHYINRHSFRDKLLRWIWSIVWLVCCRFSFRHFHAWRIFFLRLFGAEIGKKCAVLPSVKIRAPWNLSIGNYVALSDQVECYSVDKIEIGDYVTISQGSFLCCASHDISSPIMELTHKPIIVKPEVWIAARVFIGPGVIVGEGAIVGACAVVTKNVEPWSIVGGNPARFIKVRALKKEE